tara:strand:+ start:5316 stop:5546 length:231 start_codon:yes stop_codon:yes gene_type:complete
MGEETQETGARQYYYLSVILFSALIIFVLVQNIFAVKLVLMGTVCLKAYGFLVKQIGYEFYSCLLYMALLVYFLLT